MGNINVLCVNSIGLKDWLILISFHCVPLFAIIGVLKLLICIWLKGINELNYKGITVPSLLNVVQFNYGWEVSVIFWDAKFVNDWGMQWCTLRVFMRIRNKLLFVVVASIKKVFGKNDQNFILTYMWWNSICF